MKYSRAIYHYTPAIFAAGLSFSVAYRWVPDFFGWTFLPTCFVVIASQTRALDERLMKLEDRAKSASD